MLSGRVLEQGWDSLGQSRGRGGCREFPLEPASPMPWLLVLSTPACSRLHQTDAGLHRFCLWPCRYTWLHSVQRSGCLGTTLRRFFLFTETLGQEEKWVTLLGSPGGDRPGTTRSSHLECHLPRLPCVDNASRPLRPSPTGCQFFTPVLRNSWIIRLRCLHCLFSLLCEHLQL